MELCPGGPGPLDVGRREAEVRVAAAILAVEAPDAISVTLAADPWIWFRPDGS